MGKLSASEREYRAVVRARKIEAGLREVVVFLLLIGLLGLFIAGLLGVVAAAIWLAGISKWILVAIAAILFFSLVFASGYRSYR